MILIELQKRRFQNVAHQSEYLNGSANILQRTDANILRVHYRLRHNIFLQKYANKSINFIVNIFIIIFGNTNITKIHIYFLETFD